MIYKHKITLPENSFAVIDKKRNKIFSTKISKKSSRYFEADVDVIVDYLENWNVVKEYTHHIEKDGSLKKQKELVLPLCVGGTDNTEVQDIVFIDNSKDLSKYINTVLNNAT